MNTLAAVPLALGHSSSSTVCFHCGRPLSAKRHVVRIGGHERDTCCAGCQAVAGLIAGQGLHAYYRHRTQWAPPPLQAHPRFEHYDQPGVRAGYVTQGSGGTFEASLLLDGVSCAACLWLIEQRLLSLAGVRAVSINQGTRRVRVAWDERCIKLSAILAAIAALGYGAELYDAQRSETALARERRDLLWRLFVAGFGMMQVMMYAIPAYISEDGMPRDIERLLHWASLVLTVPVVVWSCAPFFRGALRALLARTLNRDVPVSLGILAAFAASSAAMLSGRGEVYFDSVAMFAFLLLLARYLELAARTRAAREHDRLARLVPALALRLPAYPDALHAEEVPAAVLKTGDVVEVRPGAAVPADAVVIEGESEVNESLLTGESVPVARRKGEPLLAGSVNGGGLMRARVSGVGGGTAVADIVRLMDRALAEKPRIASLADRAAAGFVLALLLSAAVCAAVWWRLDPSRVAGVVVSLLIITCPCALSLATPAALLAATGALARRGVLITRGHALETLARATHFVFDKTGTLTQGRMSLIGVMPLGIHGEGLLREYAAALEAASPHPLARALAAQPSRFQAQAVKHHTGQGVEGVISGVRMCIGSPEFAARWSQLPLPRETVFVADGVQVAALASEREWLGLFTLGDTVRGGARHVVHALREQGAGVMLLSGDRECAVARVAGMLGIPAHRSLALPADKVAAIKTLQDQGAVVAAVGDGINDAPLLAQAQVSVAMAHASELARLSSDVILLNDRIEPLLDAVQTARRTLRVIRQNLAWALVYNGVAVPLAAAGLVTPLIAATGMALSSLLVVANALRLERAN